MIRGLQSSPLKYCYNEGEIRLMKKSTADTVFEIVEPYAKEFGLEIYDIEYIKEGADYFLRIYIDKPDGTVISTDDCEKLSRAIDPILDEKDPIQESYYLEVSSVGLDRHLKLDKDFMRFMGQMIEVKLFAPINNLKEFYGKLCDYQNGDFTVELLNGEKITVNIKKASLIRPYIEF